MLRTTVKRSLALILAMVMCCSLLPLGVSAADGPAVSSNINDHYYINAQRWTDPINSTLYPEDGGFTRVEHINGSLVVEKYDKNFKYLSGKTLALELPIYGGVYMCDDYNFVVVGQNNYEEDDTVEVFRIIRYSKDWVRQASCSLYGANTIEPFQAGCVRFDRSGDFLYIRTAHKMYASANDGLNHQANVMINVRVSDMTVTDSLTEVLNKNYGYISHSFNQFVRVDGTDLLAVDHGDALPRSIVLIKYGKPAGQASFYGRVSYVNALPIVQSTYHYNDTGVSLGGFECSSSHYLIAGNSYDGTEAIDLMYAHRNIFVTATPKNNFTDEATAVHWLTDYTAADQVDVSPPHMVKLGDDYFCLIWTEDGVLKYCFLNGKGELEGEIITGKGALSDCVPVVEGNRIVWYVTNNSAPVFYEISTLPPHVHSYSGTVTAPTCTEGGYTTYTCACGDSYQADEVPALGHDYVDRVCTRCGHTIVLNTPAKPYKITNVVSGVHVYWKATEGAQKYGVWRSETGEDGTYKWLANPTVPHFTDVTAESGKTYHYRVTSMAEGFHSDKSEAVAITYVSTPDITSRTNTAAGVALGWQKIEGATGYAIYRKTYEGTDAWVRVGTISGGSTLTWTDTSVKNNNGEVYKYTIRALADADMATLSGCRAAGRTMVRLSSQYIKSVTATGSTSAKLSWSTSSRVTGYEVRFLIDGQVYKTFTIGNYKTGVKTFTGLKAGQTYTVQVRTYKKVEGVGSFYSDWSTAKTVNT